MVATTTRATKALNAAGISYSVHTYHVDEQVGDGYGEAVAKAIGLPAPRVFKTLVAEVDGRDVVAIVPVPGRLSTKALARAAGGKRCSLAAPGTAERLTGYVVGGVSPFGQRRSLPIYLDETAIAFDTIAVSGGVRGLQLEVSPHDLIEMTQAFPAPLSA